MIQPIPSRLHSPRPVVNTSSTALTQCHYPNRALLGQLSSDETLEVPFTIEFWPWNPRGLATAGITEKVAIAIVNIL